MLKSNVNTGGKFTISAVETGGKFRKNVTGGLVAPSGASWVANIFAAFWKNSNDANVIIWGREKMVHKEPEIKNLVALSLWGKVGSFASPAFFASEVKGGAKKFTRRCSVNGRIRE